MFKPLFYINVLLFFILAGFAPQVYAQTIGENIIEQLNDGTNNIDQAAKDISDKTGISPDGSKDFLNNVIQGKNINVPAAASIIDGFASGKINPDQIKTVNDAVKNLQKIASPEAAQDLLKEIGGGFIPPKIGKALSTVQALGDLKNFNNLESLLKLPAVKAELDKLFAQGVQPEEITQLISKISKVGLSLDAFKNLSIGDIADQLSQSFQNALPDLFNNVLAELGLNGLFETFGLQIFSEFSGLDSFFIAGSLAPNYETFDRDPKSSAVDKSCSFSCGATSCPCREPIEKNHIKIRAHMTDEMIKHRTWMIDEFMKVHILPAMMMMTDQLSAIAMAHTFAIGKFFDAKHQMESERIFQQLMAQTHSDYQPSVGLCEIASSARGLIPAQEKSKVARIALTNRMSERARRNEGSLSSAGTNSDVLSRFSNFKDNYCNVNDNGRGLAFLCDGTTATNERINKDVNITQTLFSEQTIDADFVAPNADPDIDNNIEGRDLLAFSTNLFASELNPDIPRLNLATPDGKAKEGAFVYMDLRSIMAKRSVAEDAFSAVVSERVSGLEQLHDDDRNSDSYLKRLVVDLGVAEDEIDILLGKSPSYYAQRKVLSSYIFENPKFYTQLYESPANVLRKDTAIKTLSLALEDDFFDRQLEAEAMLATLLEVMLEDSHSRVSGALTNLEPEDN